MYVPIVEKKEKLNSSSKEKQWQQNRIKKFGLGRIIQIKKFGIVHIAMPSHYRQMSTRAEYSARIVE